MNKFESVEQVFDCLPAGDTMQLSEADDVLSSFGLPRLTELLRSHFYDLRREKADEEKTRHAREQAESQASGIADMVAALECDYGRLEELRDERDALQESVFDALDWLDENNATDELKFFGACVELADAEDNLVQWGRNYAEELAELEQAAGDCTDREDAAQRISEDPLSVEVRTGWYAPGSEDNEPEEFQILLCTGGPAARIRGELDQYNQPSRAWLEYQDWFTAWMEYHGDAVSQSDLLTYCQQFFFGQ